jgi:hypothetical protein
MIATHQSQVESFGNLNLPARGFGVGLGLESCGSCNDNSIHGGVVQVEVAPWLMYVNADWFPIHDQILNIQIDSRTP